MRSALMLVSVALMFAGAPGSASAGCSCQCVEGLAHTLCSSLEEAQANPYACGAGPTRVVCPLAPVADQAPLQYPPPAGASNCRSARLWDPHGAQYSVAAKVCEATAAVGPVE